jgi:phage baseplate assembly protein W
MAIKREVLGRGLQYPLQPGSDGGFRKDIADPRIIKSCIGIILMTRIGERVWNPEFGSELYSLKHEPNSKLTWRIVQEEVLSSVKRWEPRIDQLSVTVVPAPSVDREGNFLLQINISYRIIASNTPDNFVFPFYLEA